MYQRIYTDMSQALILEPALGEGGYVMASAEYLRGVQEICNEHGILLIADEVSTAITRDTCHNDTTRAPTLSVLHSHYRSREHTSCP
jgi:glutamate-1-semialdehyde aminotransferase